MSGSQIGGEQSILVGDMRAGFVRLAAASILSKTRRRSDAAVTRKMRLPALVVACSAVVVNALAPTKVLRCVEKVWPILKSSKKEPP